MMSRRSVLAGAAALAALTAIELASAGKAFVASAAAHTGHGQSHARAFAAGAPGNPRRPFRVVEIVMAEGSGTMTYTPDRIEVKKGEQIKFVLKNVGLLDHEFLVDSVANNARHKNEMEAKPDMQHEEPNGTTVKPGARGELLWRFTKSGTFEFACLIPGHYEAGMKGTLVVK
jgi:uncharacterized cupredoxin-like copper-binding protein